MTPTEQSNLAAQAGLETGEVFPGDTPWRRRFVELLIAETERENAALREALDWYAQPSNWKREVRDVGPRVNWTKPPAAFDRGARALFVLMTLEGER